MEKEEMQKIPNLSETTRFNIKRVELVREVELIQINLVVGTGTEDDPVVPVQQFWNKKGELIAEADPLKPFHLS